MITAQRRSQSPQNIPADLTLDIFALDDDRDITLAEARASLSKSEQIRAERFRFEQDRKRYSRGRGFLRRELGRRLNVPAVEVSLIEVDNKKPALSGSGPGFNLSHSGDLAVLAIRDSGPVGVDLELADRAIDPDTLAIVCMQDDETAVLGALSDSAKHARFLAFWTAKEALMKLTGKGLYLDPKSIALRLENGVPTGFKAPSRYRTVTLNCPDFGPDMHIAVAWDQS